METLIKHLSDAGLIQFGLFRRGGETMPVQVNLALLGSYPNLLRLLAAHASEVLLKAGLPVTGFSRLLAPVSALPFALALGLPSQVPVVYSQGNGGELAFDLVGAYDSGHQALLVLTHIEERSAPLALAAQRVGLQVEAVLTLIDLEVAAPLDRVPLVSVLRLSSVVEVLVADGRLPPRMEGLVETWIAEKQANSD